MTVFALALAALALAGDPPPIVLRDIAPASGVDFRFHDGSRGEHDLPEVMGGGVALIDADADGDLDLYFCQGGPIGAGPDPPCRFYRNNGDGTFADATDQAGVPGPSYAMGASVGDVDGDGRDDLLVTGWRGLRLYRSRGDGTFDEITEPWGLADAGDLWTTSAAFADLDGDGDLDLYIASYLKYDPANAPYCAAPDGRRDYCGPEGFPAEPDRLYRNDGDRFVEIGDAAGLVRPDDGRGLGVLIADLVGDERSDVYVANDGSRCLLYENRGDLRFAEVGLASGVAVDARGKAPAGMGVALGDLDGDGLDDLIVANIRDRGTLAFRNRGGGLYADDSIPLGIAGPTRPVTGFGLVVEDLDADGRPDLFQANGHVLDRERPNVPFAMPSTLLRNLGGRFVAAPAEGPLARPTLGRGLAAGDLDGDGRPELVLASLDAPPAILRADPPAGHWLALELIGAPPSHRSAVGARLEVEAGGRSQARQVVGGGSYLSASDRRLFFGLGAAAKVDRLTVRWPSGRVESWPGPPVDRVVRLREGDPDPTHVH